MDVDDCNEFVNNLYDQTNVENAAQQQAAKLTNEFQKMQMRILANKVMATDQVTIILSFNFNFKYKQYIRLHSNLSMLLYSQCKRFVFDTNISIKEINNVGSD
jgi:hypothetical protein